MLKKYFRFKKRKAKMAEAKHRGTELVEPTSAAELLRILECPVCTEVPLPPIHTCTRGHIACNTCLSKLLTCALCKSPFTDARNFVMENIVDTSFFSCKYKDNGCAQTIRGDFVRDHLKKCVYRNGPVAKISQVSKNDVFSCYEWKPFHKNIPKNAVSAGSAEGGNSLYVIRSKLPSGLIVPGKWIENTSTAIFSLDGMHRITSQFEILESVPFSLTWTRLFGSTVLDHAVSAGKDNMGRVLYVGRCGNEEIPSFGYVFEDMEYCWASTNGKVYKKSFDVQILVKNSKGISVERTKARAK